ncbi:uncharacterized protein F4817DRAFT_354105 [Daldinia loculata]|uniref:uncharacterized protein n=1 Tax=Daldinia loculata TaxID=103429 RepID=UPI0020C3E3F5|nr:uncharacterized protein F4817DRAFT_354105 [Daldinia loculata]KAI1642035.1 hypothetical protein F4817DRAFT_354105 [Daldinia loculata]
MCGMRLVVSAMTSIVSIPSSSVSSSVRWVGLIMPRRPCGCFSWMAFARLLNRNSVSHDLSFKNSRYDRHKYAGYIYYVRDVRNTYVLTPKHMMSDNLCFLNI